MKFVDDDDDDDLSTENELRGHKLSWMCWTTTSTSELSFHSCYYSSVHYEGFQRQTLLSIYLIEWQYFWYFDFF